jgi:hypothetical protein
MMASNDNKHKYANNGDSDDCDSSTDDFSSEPEEEMNLPVNSDEKLLI